MLTMWSHPENHLLRKHSCINTGIINIVIIYIIYNNIAIMNISIHVCLGTITTFLNASLNLLIICY